MIDGYMGELGAALHVRGGARRRFLLECRAHLEDAAAERGEAEAVRAFGPPEELAAAFDAEVAAQRGVRATFATVAGVLATGGSTLALIHAASSGSHAPVAWAIVFFVAAQLSAVAAGLALLQALAQRRAPMSPAEAVLLARRNACALIAAGVTMFAAGAAVPGNGSALLLLAGPALVCVALVAVLRARSFARRLARGVRIPVRPALHDVPVPPLRTGVLLALTALVAALAAFARDVAEHAAAGEALVAAGIEATAVIACFAALGPALGLWRRTH